MYGLVTTKVQGSIWRIAIERSEVRNAVDGPTAFALVNTLRAFEADERTKIAILGTQGAIPAPAPISRRSHPAIRST